MKFEGFTIHHFADDVCYDSQAFLRKNNEAVHGDTAKLLKKSKNPIVVTISQLGVSTKKKKKKSVSAVFFGGIKTLMKNLKRTEPYFVRCCNPNGVKSSKVWTESVVKGELIPSDRPHPYGVSSRSYQRLVQRKKNQSVIVCGESGAGFSILSLFPNNLLFSK